MKKLIIATINYASNIFMNSGCVLEYFEKDGKSIRIKKNESTVVTVKFLKVAKCVRDSLELIIDKGQAFLKFETNRDLMEFKNWLEIDEVEKKIMTDLLEHSFHLDLRGHAELKISSQKYLSNKIKKFMSQYDSTYYGPVTTICQSSGFGKSRACESLANEGMFVVFCCLRDKDSVGYPPRSCLADFFFVDSESENQVINSFKCYFNFFIDILNGDDKSIDCKDFFVKYCQQTNRSLPDLVKIKLNKTTNKTKLSKYTGDKPLIFIFDESASLLRRDENRESNYFILRRFLSKIRGNIFVLFTDTFTNLSDYIPFTKQSLREKVFDPIYLLPTWDIFADYEALNSILDTMKFENVCRFGRVLWGSLIYTKINSSGKFNEMNNSEIFNLVISKLIGGKKFESAKLDSNDHLAILSTRLGMVRPKSASTSQNLVAKNMAVCLYANTSDNIFEIEYPSEPILSFAGSFLMDRFNPSGMLDDYISCVESSLISQGEKGETIAKLILIWTIDKISLARDGDNLSKLLQITSVGEFVQNLYGKCIKNCGDSANNWKCSGTNQNCPVKMINLQIKNSSELLGGLINFNHFTRSKEYLADTCLKNALKRRAAIHCRKLQKGIDLIIPISLNKNNFDSISSIMVQVKLEKKPSKPDYVTAFDAISPKMFSDLAIYKPYLLLYMQLGLNAEKPYICNIKDGVTRGKENLKQAVLYSEGIGTNIFPNLDENFLCKIKSFSISESNLFESEKENEIYDFTKYAI